MTNKIDLELINQIKSPASLDEKVLRHANLKIAPKKRAFGKFALSLATAYGFGLLTMLTFNQISPLDHSLDNISANDINLESLKMETRSGELEQAKIDLDALDEKQLQQIAKALASKGQWPELEKLTLYIQQRKY